MAEPVEVPAEIEIKRYPHSDIYIGCKEALVASGLVTRGMFPGEPGRNKYTQTYRDQSLSIRRVRKNFFEIHVTTTKVEEVKRRQREDDELAAANARAALDRKLDGLPDSKGNFRLRSCEHAAVTMAGVLNYLAKFGHGYRFHEDTIAAFLGHLTDALDTLKGAPIVFDQAARDAYVAELQREAAAADPTFQAFMAVATSEASDVTLTGDAEGE